jgi:uncharacterized membrane protein YhaH (DUF805 family)
MWYNISGDVMKILKKENWWVWLLLLLFSQGSSNFVLGALLDVYDKKAWYTRWYIWVIGLVLIIPFGVMITVFTLQILSKTAAKLDVKGSEYYLSPYIWIILIIIPFIGWIAFAALTLYLEIAILVKLHAGNGEKYI